MDSFLTNTCDHLNNPTGAATLSEVATGIACMPIDPASKAPTDDYPISKLFLLRETFTKYADFVTGDYLVSGGTTYAVRFVGPWAAQGGLDAFYHLILEEQLGS
ncbi:MAG TPA: hypothetical protein VGD99_21815 [Anaerolineae bacterium]|jgi:hypothetical protein